MTPPNRKSNGRLVGSSAIGFNLPDFEGNAHRLEDYRGSWLLMVFHRHLG
ncbi:MAG: peroxiredoxin family protein [Desulfobacteraceae bacterium]|nr:peroxiredoxin family protein [Desulfobacteraceae bacterium]